MIKFERNYQLNIQTPSGGTLSIELPFTIEFDITRHTLSSANVCQIRIYNLSELNRNQILFNAYNVKDFRLIELKAGYGNNLATIFVGNITQAWSVREGVNFITQIECYDGGFAFVNGDVNLSFVAGTPLQVVIQTLMLRLPNITFGACGIFPGVLGKGETYSGNPAQILTEITGGAFFIDNGKSYALKSTDYIQTVGLITVINADTGLLNTPILEQTMGRFEMLFEPSLNVGSLVSVVSLTNPLLNGIYKTTGVKHRGMISGAVAGELSTIGEFYNSKEKVPVLGS